MRLFKKLKFVRSPAALGADREREGHNFTLIVQDFAERRSALVFGEDDTQVAGGRTADPSARAKALGRNDNLGETGVLGRDDGVMKLD